MLQKNPENFSHRIRAESSRSLSKTYPLRVPSSRHQGMVDLDLHVIKLPVRYYGQLDIVSRPSTSCTVDYMKTSNI